MHSREYASDYGALRDEQLACLYSNGEQEAFAELAVRYMSVIRNKASELESHGADADDLFQEGLIALDMAAVSFREDKGASFRTYAGTCIRNRLISAIRSQNSGKNRINNTALSLEEQLDAAASPDTEPESVFMSVESLGELWASIEQSLSSVELSVLRRYLEGDSYEKIASELGITVKSCDNAMQRVRRKLRTLIR